MFELLRVYLGYCLQCRRATVVGEFKLSCWKHSFTMCSSCLGAAGKGVDNESEALLSQLAAEAQTERVPR